MDFIGQDWEYIIQDESQRIKFNKAFTEEYRPCYISKESYAGTFRGEQKTIVCYLTENRCCNCEEYQYENREHLPCSHMYRLAYELGFIDRSCKAMSIRPNMEPPLEEKNRIFVDVISVIEKRLTLDDQVSFIESKLLDCISKCLSGPTNIPFRALKEDVNHYIDVGLLDVCKDSNIGLIYCHGFRYSILDLLDEKGFPWPEDFPKTKAGKVKDKAKWDWCLAHPNETVEYAFTDVPDTLIMVRPSKELSSVWNMVLQYFERKFFDTESNDKFFRYKIKHPTGAVITNHIERSFEFPQDVITEQLTKHGHNRCITKENGVLTGRLYKNYNSSRSFSLDIKRPRSSDFEPFIEPLSCLCDFYNNDSSNDVNAFCSVINCLKELDCLLDKTADDNFVILAVIHSLINKHIKDEAEIKKDFETVKVIMDNGETIYGYRNISTSSLNEIDKVVFERN